jgi:hypothetical protein
MAIAGLASGQLEAARGGARQAVTVASSKSVAAAGKASGSQSETVAAQPTARYVVFGILALAGGFIGGMILQHLFHPGMTRLPGISAGIRFFALDGQASY